MISLSSRRKDYPPFPLWNSLWFVHSSIDLTTESRRHRKHESFFALINRDIYCILVYSSILFSIFSHHSTADKMLLIHVEVNLLYTFVGKKHRPIFPRWRYYSHHIFQRLSVKYILQYRFN